MHSGQQYMIGIAASSMAGLIGFYSDGRDAGPEPLILESAERMRAAFRDLGWPWSEVVQSLRRVYGGNARAMAIVNRIDA